MGMKITGVEKVTARLQAVSDRARDLRPVMKAENVSLASDERTVFETAGASAGHPWKPLAASTLRSKVRTGLLTGIRPLVLSGALERSLTANGGRYSIRQTGKTWFNFGTKDTVAHLHQLGSREGLIPARPFLSFTEQQKTEWIARIKRYLVHGEV